MALRRFAATFPAEYAALRARYGGPGRPYHGWGHIEALLAAFDGNGDAIRQPEAMEIAIYYHDAIYAPLSASNEVDSAALMVADLTGRLSDTAIHRAEALILATAKHRVPAGITEDLAADCALFLDMDLSILGASDEAFDTYDAAIRQEYAMVPNETYFSGRRDILARFLERPRLFLTDRYHERLDAPARANLRRAIARCDQELSSMPGTGS